MPDTPAASPTRIRGRVIRWGTRGYGFLSSDQLPRDAWCHVRFIADPDLQTEHPLPFGLEVEFEPREIEGGQYQAHAVTRPGVAPFTPSTAATELRSPMRGLEQLARLRLSASAVESPRAVVAPPRPVPSSSGASPSAAPPVDGREIGGIAAQVAAARRRTDAVLSQLDQELARVSGQADDVERRVDDVTREIAERLAALERERDRTIADLRRQADRLREEAEAVRTRRDALPAADAEARRILQQALHQTRVDLARALKDRADAVRAVAAARAAAAAAAGERSVVEYEEVRRRLSSAADGLERRAYELAETASRPAMRGYAEALDRTAGGPVALTVVVASDLQRERLTLVAPLSWSDVYSDDALFWRVGAFLCDAAERAGLEMNAAVSAGAVLGCVAIQLRPWSVDAELIEVALQDAWSARPSLSASLALRFEYLDEAEICFNADDAPAEPPRPPRDDSPDGSLRRVAARLGLSLPDVVASLVASGLPSHDDQIESGVEQSLIRLIGLPVPESAAEPPAPEEAAAEPDIDRSAPPAIAKRLLEKLLRDHRVGARHTHIDNAWAHHFSNDEKEVARTLTERLVRRGVLLSKPKPGGDHISINPRRIGEVHGIVALKAADPSLFADL